MRWGDQPRKDMDVLEKGGTEEAMVLFKRFRGREPVVEPLLVKRGLLEPKP